MKRAFPIAALALMLTACASGPPPVVERTMKSLDDQPRVLLREVTPTDRELALRAWEAYLAVGTDRERRMLAMRRIADLKLLVAEDALASGRSGRADFVDAVEAYRALLAEFPDYPHQDEVHYQVARAWDNANDDARSLAALERVVREHPGSPHYIEAQFRRGELLFARADYVAAEEAYRAVTAAGGDAPFFGQAQYKLGWARYQQTRFEEALGDFIAVLERSLVSGAEFRTVLAPGALPRAQRELVDDTLRAISLAFERLGGPPAIDAYFAAAGSVSFEPLIHTSLSEHYLARGMYEEAAATLAGFVTRRPDHEQAPLFQIRIAEVYERSGQPLRAEAARQGLVREYGPQSAFWSQRDLARMPALAERLRGELLDIAQRSHAAAQASGSDADYEAAARAYRDFLAFFPEDERAPELAFLLGELLYESGRYGDAVEYYEQSAYRYSPHERSAESGYAALLSYERHIDGLQGEEERRAWRARSIDAASRFASQFPRHPEVAAVLTRAAQDLFRNGQHARALTFALRVTTTAADAAPALQRAAWIVAGDVQVERGALEQAEAYYLNARSAAPGAGGAEDPINERLATVIYRQGERARDHGDAASAMAHFERAAAAAPGSAVAETATYDSAALAITARDWTAAIARLEAFRRDWPASTLGGEVTRKLAVAYLEAGQVHAAAEEFARIAADEGEDPEVAREASWRSAELYERAGDRARALLAWQRYIVAHPEPVDRAIEARLRIAEAFHAQGDGAAQRRWLEEIVEAHDRAGGQVSDFSRQAAAQAQLELAAPLREAYVAIELRHPLERSLRAKREAMDAALEAYGRAASYGVPEVTTRATYRIGGIYREFARALLDSERPGGLDELELEEYDVLLEEQAFPFEEEAIKLHEVNYRRIAQGVYDAWVRASLAELAELMPVRYARNERRIEYVEAIH